ncbi:rhodanese-like domain-containing protein [Pseudonocardia sp. N23]|uniref:MBL fold metallo-hydrolase n=1 Tax=Pseudonocardia sp. N23 TaxID=1987376 RepID=UPI000BFC8F65|nr:MBL fold metallo-hydrolase [Pseudonocardia sp. N23]GAY07662.1 hydroxyacylglutathione hydrolase [Pseudonocardia sp. N23]
MIEILPIETIGLGDRSYLAHDGRVSMVVDPQRDIDRVLAVAAEAGVTITHVFETHVHNDYVTGGLALARATGAVYLLNADDDVAFERTGLHDGEVVTISAEMAVRALHTPGHTHTHLSYALLDAAGDPVAVFSGGSLLFGATGRPDLLGPDHTDALVHAQWHSARRLATALPGAATLHPTHGFGSFCSASASASGTTGTVADETRTNPALTLDEEHYVRDLLAGLDAFPAYYAHMAPANSAGPDAPDLTPPAVADAGDLRRRIDAGEWVVDLRDGTAFAAGHVAGSINIGLTGQFVTYLGWLIPWGTPVTLLGATATQVADAQREMVRIGIDRPAVMATGNPEDWTGTPVSFRRATFADLAAVLASGDGPAVLDVRRTSERATTAISGSVHIPIHEILARLDEVPAGPVWVHCAGGYRAGVAASLLHARGHDVVAIDDDVAQAVASGLTATTDRATV